MAILKMITITGIDDESKYSDLLNIINKFNRRVPILEFGILLSNSNAGFSRFPSDIWITNFFTYLYNNQARGKVGLSLHICGSILREDVCFGNWVFSKGRHLLVDGFNRIQLNFHGEPHRYNERFFDGLKRQNKQIIFQMDRKNEHLYFEARERDINCVPFFDLSHGAGILPDEWPLSQGNLCGYAGGLSPDNVTEQLHKIHKKAGDSAFWIDVETGIRTNGKTDIEKIRDFITISEAFISIR